VHGFESEPLGDTIDAKRRGCPPSEVEQKLEMLGFLLGFTRLLDQKLDDMGSVEAFAEEFITKTVPQS
jgi:hypothetical protein